MNKNLAKMRTRNEIRERLIEAEGLLGQVLFFARAHAQAARRQGYYEKSEQWQEEVASKEGERDALRWVLGEIDSI